MSNYPETFATREAAESEAATFAGWDKVEVQAMYMPDDKNADASGQVFVITTEGGTYREDGQIN